MSTVNEGEMALAMMQLIKKLIPIPIRFYWQKVRIQRLGLNVNTPNHWNSVWEKEGLEGREYDALHKTLISLVPPNSAVLDLGCGNGQILRKLKEQKSCRCTGLDFSDHILERLRALGFETIRSVLPEVPCGSDMFDVVTCTETLEHLSDPRETVQEMHRAAKPGGLLILSAPDGCIHRQVGGEHVQVFTPTDLVNLLRPFTENVYLATVTDAGWSYLCCWGRKPRTPDQRPGEADSLPSQESSTPGGESPIPESSWRKT